MWYCQHCYNGQKNSAWYQSNEYRFHTRSLGSIKRTASVADVGVIRRREANTENHPFEDEIFDVVLSSFGQVFATSHRQEAIKEMVQVTIYGEGIAFSTWPFWDCKWKIFKDMAKYHDKYNFYILH